MKEKVIGRASDGRSIVKRVISGVPKLYKEQYAREKRMKELAKRGYKPENIAAMLYEGKGDVGIKKIKKAIKNSNVKLDGRL